MLKLMYITNESTIAEIVQKNGVERIFIDLETLNKEIRQKDRDSVKSHHTFKDIRIIRQVIDRSAGFRSELLVRINPIHEKSAIEIGTAIEYGADILMLPMWKTIDEVKKFLRLVNGRARTMLLLETREAEAILDDVVKLHGVDEIFIGLNDLHMSYGKRFMFELLADGTVERICRKIASCGIFFGFGGISRIGQGMLPAEYILGEHYRLHSGMVILSRSFCDASKEHDIDIISQKFITGVADLRAWENIYKTWDDGDYEKNRKMVCTCVGQIVHKLECEAAER